MQDLLDHPYYVKDPENELTDAQKWAVITARLKKAPGWRGIPKGGSGYAYYRDFALAEVKAQSNLGQDLRDAEMWCLRHLREDLLAGADINSYT